MRMGVRKTRSDYVKGDMIGLTTHKLPRSLLNNFKTFASAKNFKANEVCVKKSIQEKAVEMFV